MTTIKKSPSLKAMAEIPGIATEDRQVSKSVPTFDVDPRIIKVRPGFNMRPVDMEHVALMREAALGGAVFPPMWVVIEDGEVCMLDGEHRLTMYMGLPTIPTRVKVMEFKGNMAAQILFMMGCAKGKVALPLQTGQQYALLENTYGMSYAEIAKGAGVSVQSVKDMIRLTQQEVEITGLIKDGIVTATTALKLVKSVGSKEAGKTLQAAAVVAKSEGKKVTQKTIDKLTPPQGITAKDKANAAKSIVATVASRSDAVKDHLRAMLESPSVTGPNREHVKAVLAICEGKQPEAAAPAPESVASFLSRQGANENEIVRQAVGVLTLVLTGKDHMIPKTGTPEGEDYGHRLWLEKMAEGRRQEARTLRHAAHWFIAVLNNHHTGREIAPPPSVMPLDEAIQAEIDSAGAVSAVELCPEAEALITYLKGRK